MERESTVITRIDRTDDENLYQPKIHSRRIRQLYQISLEANLPMTVILDQAIEGYINLQSQQNNERT